MSTKSIAAVAEPELDKAELDDPQAGRPKRQPPYNVILWDDDDNTYDYVIKMMRKLFGHTLERGVEIAVEVDTGGRAICLTTTREHAELKRDQIHAFGKDPQSSRCAGSMSSTIEPIR